MSALPPPGSLAPSSPAFLLGPCTPPSPLHSLRAPPDLQSQPLLPPLSLPSPPSSPLPPTLLSSSPSSRSVLPQSLSPLLPLPLLCRCLRCRCLHRRLRCRRQCCRRHYRRARCCSSHFRRCCCSCSCCRCRCLRHRRCCCHRNCIRARCCPSLTSGRDNGAQLHLRRPMRASYVSWQVPRRLHSAPASRLRCSGLSTWLNSAEIVRLSTGSEHLRCTSGRDNGAQLHLQRAPRASYASFMASPSSLA